MPQASSHVIIAANPKSGAADSEGIVAELAEAIRSRGFQCQVLTSLPEVQRCSRRLFISGELRAVVAAGGDGTAGVLANLLDDQIPLLVFPLGTENLLAKYLGLQRDVRQACEVLLHGRVGRMDVGSANGRLFLVMLSCGFDADVVRNMDARRRGHINRWSYAGPILNSLRHYAFPQLQIRATRAPPLPSEAKALVARSADQAQEKKKAATRGEPSSDMPVRDMLAQPEIRQQNLSAAWLFVFNVPRYAAGLHICPAADPTDGLLDICTFRGSGMMQGFYYLSQLWLARHQKLRDFRHDQCQDLVVEASDNVAYQIDGDPGGSLPLEVKILSQRLSVLVPEKSTVLNGCGAT